MLRASRLFYCAASEPLVKFSQTGAVAIMTMNRPAALNALNTDISRELLGLLEKYDKDDSVRCFIITGEGRSFVAGADIKMMKDLSNVDWHKNNLFSDLNRIRDIKKPIIAAVNGFALGGGCELAMMCDTIIASEKAVFGQPEIKLGTIPGLGGTQRLTSLIGKAKAMEWVLTGQNYTAAEAEKAGLVARVVPHAELIPTAMKTAETIAGYSGFTVGIAKDCVNRSLELNLTEGLAYEKQAFFGTFASHDQKEGMSAFAEKRAANFQHK
eukprot:Tbor_TRINITY_DN5411_c2_g2::TRINITY_DN5411_c2_g2_i1::g.24336::m.24336